MGLFNGLRPELRAAAKWLFDYAHARGWNPRVTSVYRSTATQARLYRRYLAGLSPWPAAPPGTSRHEFGLAFDMVVEPLEKSRELGGLWERMGGYWGGRFNDEIHYEVR